MIRGTATNAASVVLLMLLAGCGGDPGASGPATGDEDGGGLFQANVDVDTPKLRAAKKAAGIERCEAGTAQPIADGLPEVTLQCLGGGQDVDLSALRGPLVVNLWAQWCGPCREELPFYQRLHEEAADEVAVLGIDYQDTVPEQALALAEETGVTYPLLADPDAQLRVPFRVRGLPGVVLVDADGKVTHLEYTVIRDYEQLRSLVAQHLDVTL
jgi:thiol-disulfide isomerase/thioredoxin